MIFIAYTGLVSAWLDKIRNSFTSATISGKTIKLTKHDGTEITLTTQDTTYNPATAQTDGLMSATDKDKLDGITAGAEVNQNAFSNIKVGSDTAAADTKTDTFELVAGNNVTLTLDVANDKVTIDVTDTTYNKATQSADGLLSKEDKTIIDNLGNTYAKLTGTLADNPITRTSPSGNTASFMQHGYAVGDEAEICDIGWDFVNRDGAMLGLNSANHSTLAGQFSLVARDGTNSSELQGLPNGVLKWDGKDIATIETGTWTPVLEGSTTAGVLTYAEQYGWYKKINDLVFVVGKIEVSGYTTLPTGIAVIRGLPYSATNASARYFGGANGMNGLNDSFNIITGVTFLGNTSSINLFVNSRTNIGKTRYYAEFTSNPSNNEFGIALAQSSQRIYFNCLYRTA